MEKSPAMQFFTLSAAVVDPQTARIRSAKKTKAARIAQSSFRGYALRRRLANGYLNVLQSAKARATLKYRDAKLGQPISSGSAKGFRSRNRSSRSPLGCRSPQSQSQSSPSKSLTAFSPRSPPPRSFSPNPLKIGSALSSTERAANVLVSRKRTPVSSPVVQKCKLPQGGGAAGMNSPLRSPTTKSPSRLEQRYGSGSPERGSPRSRSPFSSPSSSPRARVFKPRASGAGSSPTKAQTRFSRGKVTSPPKITRESKSASPRPVSRVRTEAAAAAATTSSLSRVADSSPKEEHRHGVAAGASTPQQPAAAAAAPRVAEAAAAKRTTPLKWFYIDFHGSIQGPFTTRKMKAWRTKGRLPDALPVRSGRVGAFRALCEQEELAPFPIPGAPTSLSN